MAAVVFVVVATWVSVTTPPASIAHCVDDIEANYSHITDPEAQCKHLRDLNPSMFDNLYKEQ